MSGLPLPETLQNIFDRMQRFEASASVANTGTGARREGEGFERLVGELWEAVRLHAIENGAQSQIVAGVRSRRWAKLTVEDRSIFVPNDREAPQSNPGAQSYRWLEVVFPVSELITAFPGISEANNRYAPTEGPFAGDGYPSIYAGLSTKFDDTIVLEQGGVLREKILLEYKTAKSSCGRQLDGNAHERLSFQIMQYLEIATRYTRCSLVVIANGAFALYRNKYHVNFHVQADRLANFSWFTMQHFCMASEYQKFVEGLIYWLFEGTDRNEGTN